MTSWEIYVRVEGHCEFWSIELDDSGRATGNVAFGKLLGGSSPRLFSYSDGSLADKKRREKLAKGYDYVGKRKYPKPTGDDLRGITCG